MILFQFCILFQAILASQRDYQMFMKNSGGFDPIPNMTLGILPNSPDCTLLFGSAGPISYNGTHVGNVYDAPIRRHWFNIQNGILTYESELQPSQFLDHIKNKGVWDDSMLFRETVPSRPGKATLNPGSVINWNIGSVPNAFGDDIVYMTDFNSGMKFSVNNRTPEEMTFKSTPVLDASSPMMSEHAMIDSSDSTITWDILNDLILPKLTLLKINATSKNKDGKPMGKSFHIPGIHHPEIHSFFQTDNYIIAPIGGNIINMSYIFDSATHRERLNLMNMITQSDKPELAFVVFDKKGEKEPFQVTSDSELMITHTASAFEEEDENTIILRAGTMERCNAFLYSDWEAIFGDESIWEEALQCLGSCQIREFEIDLKSKKTTKMKVLGENLEYPQTNKYWKMPIDRCYIYATYVGNLRTKNLFNGIAKINVCDNTVPIQEWVEPEQFNVEPIFLPNKNMKSELDGYVVALKSDINKLKSSIIFLDPKTMMVSHEFELPEFVALSDHWGLFGVPY